MYIYGSGLRSISTNGQTSLSEMYVAMMQCEFEFIGMMGEVTEHFSGVVVHRVNCDADRTT